MKSRLVAGLPTAVASLVALAGLVVPQVPAIIAANPELVSALVALLTAVANFSPSPAKRGK